MQEIENVVLITEQDEPIGLMEKQQAHIAGVLHRAFSVFVFNDKGELLIQQRAHEKYHTPGLWTNTCCSHPRENESYEQAALRRLQEEMGFSCPIEFQFSFIYKADVGEGLTEHEFDHVFKGTYNQDPNINPEEVASFKWIDFDELLADVENNPQDYTPWFKIILKEYIAHL